VAVVEPDGDARLAEIIESDSPPEQVDGMSSPALMLVEFQREARSQFTAEVASVLVDVLLAVERGQVQAGTPAGTDWRPSVLQRREVIERSFRLQIRSEVQRVRPLWWTRRDNAAVVRHAENHRRGRVEFRGIQKPKGGYRSQQLRLLGASGKAELDAVVQDRRLEIVTALSDGYMRVRVAVLRTWVHYCVEGRGTTPWRVHWPADDGDDSLMSDYLTVLSLRYTDFGVVEASLTHVLEFHKGFLQVAPPPLSIARWTLRKIKRLLAIEFPLGRKVRPGLLMEHVQAICSKLMELVWDENLPLIRRQFYANAGAAIAATHSPALRTGETCPGDGWNSADYWSRVTVAGMLDGDQLARSDVDSVLVQAMKRKTVYMSSVAREKANLPILYDAKASHAAAFAVWGPLLQQIDPCSDDEAAFAPAFREGGPYSPALSTSQLRETLRAIAATAVSNFAEFDYGMHSLRIGREAELRVANVRPELINDITTHTTVGGRAPYSRAERLELLQASRQADGAVVKPVETVARFGADRSAPREGVFLSPSGDRVGSGSARRVGSGEPGPAKRARTSGPTLIDHFFQKK
jgi:hypothetical protein